jgi:DNA repair protein RadC
MSNSYNSSASPIYQKESRLIERALRCLENRINYDSKLLNNSEVVSSYLRLNFAGEKNEVFAVLFLNSSHSLIAFEKLFYGTINEAAIYPRVVVQKALEHNAAAVIVAHNHPSGDCKPSFADQEITRRLKDALSLIDIRLIDHMVVTLQNTFSFAEHGLL